MKTFLIISTGFAVFITFKTGSLIDGVYAFFGPLALLLLLGAIADSFDDNYDKHGRQYPSVIIGLLKFIGILMLLGLLTYCMFYGGGRADYRM